VPAVTVDRVLELVYVNLAGRKACANGLDVAMVIAAARALNPLGKRR